MTERAKEAPCDVTGKPCRWTSDFEVHDDGSTSGTGDLFCNDCYRYRDWEKDEADE